MEIKYYPNIERSRIYSHTPTSQNDDRRDTGEDDGGSVGGGTYCANWKSHTRSPLSLQDGRNLIVLFVLSIKNISPCPWYLQVGYSDCFSSQYNKPYKIHSIPTPSSLGPNDVLIKVACASICHTEKLVSAGVFSTKLPCIASHEGTGIVVAVGSSQTSTWKAGDRVLAGILRDRCGECSDCTGPENYSNYCPYVYGNCGVTCDGAFAEYMLIDGREAARLPEEVSFDTAAPLACAGKTIYRGLKVCAETVKPGQWIGLVGSGGGLGHLGCQMGKAMGFKILGIEARDEALKLSNECGADVVIDARQGSKNEIVQKAIEAMGDTRDKLAGVEAAIVLSDDGAAMACALTRMHGTVVHISQPTTIQIPFQDVVFRDIRVRGSLLCSRQEGEEMLKLV